jgi:hypothetical protein
MMWCGNYLQYHQWDKRVKDSKKQKNIFIIPNIKWLICLTGVSPPIVDIRGTMQHISRHGHKLPRWRIEFLELHDWSKKLVSYFKMMWLWWDHKMPYVEFTIRGALKDNCMSLRDSAFLYWLAICCFS